MGENRGKEGGGISRTTHTRTIGWPSRHTISCSYLLSHLKSTSPSDSVAIVLNCHSPPPFTFPLVFLSISRFLSFIYKNWPFTSVAGANDRERRSIGRTFVVVSILVVSFYLFFLAALFHFTEIEMVSVHHVLFAGCEGWKRLRSSCPPNYSLAFFCLFSIL